MKRVLFASKKKKKNTGSRSRDSIYIKKMRWWWKRFPGNLSISQLSKHLTFSLKKNCIIFNILLDKCEYIESIIIKARVDKLLYYLTKDFVMLYRSRFFHKKKSNKRIIWWKKIRLVAHLPSLLIRVPLDKWANFLKTFTTCFILCI